MTTAAGDGSGGLIATWRKSEDGVDQSWNKCDMIKGNESLVKIFNFYFLTLLSHNIKMLHFDANPITIGYLVTEL